MRNCLRKFFIIFKQKNVILIVKCYEEYVYFYTLKSKPIELFKLLCLKYLK